jgi:peptidyl-prolyl cis-trans isomerase SurA
MKLVRLVALAFRISIPMAVIASIITVGAGLLSGPATAQQVIAFVNGEPITSYDLDQRTRLIQAINRRPPSRQEAIDELVTEKIKLQQAKRLGIEIADAMVDRAFANVAQQSGRSANDFVAAIKQAGIDLRTFKSKLRADLGWQEVLQKMSPAAFLVRDADVVAALVARGQPPQVKAIQYSLRQFVFVLHRGASSAERAARMKEAQDLRARFNNCEEGSEIARQLHGVVIKDPVVRLSTDLPAKLQQLLAETRDGQLTPPEPIGVGIEVVAVCGRKETMADLTAQREVKDRLLQQKVQAENKQLLDLLRRQSIIEYR